MRRNHLTAALTLTALGVSCAVVSSCARRPSVNLLAGKQPARADGVARPSLLTDGAHAAEGADWNAPAATTLASESASVTYDLGDSAHIESALVQADNNDDYIVAVSDDGASFRDLWIARPVGLPGLRTRATESLDARARWLRLTARGGDHVFSVSELQVWSGPLPALKAPPSSEMLSARVRAGFAYLAIAFGVVLFATRRTSSGRRVALAWALPVAAAAALAWAIAAAWPLGARELSAARAAAAAITLLALISGWDRLRRAPPHARTVVAACATGAVLAFVCFYNFGRPQFWHHTKQRPMFVHDNDMRIYQPFAKYFDELRYDGVYLASALAYAEDERGGSIDAIGAVKIRDLRDFHIRTAAELRDEMMKTKARFSPARWAEFKRDIGFFRSAMGPGFINSLDDHGANAPPAWVALARVAIGHVPANETTLTIAGLIDAALFVALAFTMWACFGLVPMLVAMTIFGATDLYMFGTNWTGATLRHDWLVLLGFTACALRKQRWALAGALLGTGTILRVIPGIGFFGIVAPAGAWLISRWMRREMPDVRALLAEHRAAARVIAGAAATMLAIFLLTGLLYGFDAWREWWVRVRALNADLATNEVTLRMLIVGVDQTSGALLRERWPLFVLADVAGVVVVLRSARQRPLEDALLLALPLALLLLNPANYHVHFVFLLALLGAGPGRNLLPIAAPLLLFCLAGYWVDLDPDSARHFEQLTALLFAALAFVYLEVIRPRQSATVAASSPPSVAR